jgi:hypothetical protein
MAHLRTIPVTQVFGCALVENRLNIEWISINVYKKIMSMNCCFSKENVCQLNHKTLGNIFLITGYNKLTDVNDMKCKSGGWRANV